MTSREAWTMYQDLKAWQDAIEQHAAPFATREHELVESISKCLRTAILTTAQLAKSAETRERDT